MHVGLGWEINLLIGGKVLPVVLKRTVEMLRTCSQDKLEKVMAAKLIAHTCSGEVCHPLFTTLCRLRSSPKGQAFIWKTLELHISIWIGG